MIPLLYEKAISRWSLLDPDEGLVGRLRDCISCTVTEERNGIYECDFEYPVTGIHFDRIQLRSGIVVTHDDTGDMQAFEVVSYSRPINGIVSFHAVHVSYRLSKFVIWATDPTNYYGRDITNVNSLDAANAIFNTAVAETGLAYWGEFGFSGGPSGTAKVAAFTGVPQTIRSLLGGVEGSVLDTFGGEFEWDGWNVILHTRGRGVGRDFSIRYGVNMTNFQDDTDDSETRFGYVPYWLGTGEQSEQIIVTGGEVLSDQMGIDTYWTTPVDLSGEFDEQPTAAQLAERARALIKQNKPYLPTQSIKVDFIRIQDEAGSTKYDELLSCNLCDSVRVIFPGYGISEYFKIVKVRWNVLLDRYDEMELGALSTTLAEALGV